MPTNKKTECSPARKILIAVGVQLATGLVSYALKRLLCTPANKTTKSATPPPAPPAEPLLRTSKEQAKEIFLLAARQFGVPSPNDGLTKAQLATTLTNLWRFAHQALESYPAELHEGETLSLQETDAWKIEEMRSHGWNAIANEDGNGFHIPPPATAK